MVGEDPSTLTDGCSPIMQAVDVPPFSPVKGGDMNDQVGLSSPEQHEFHLIVSPSNDQVGSRSPRTSPIRVS